MSLPWALVLTVVPILGGLYLYARSSAAPPRIEPQAPVPEIPPWLNPPDEVPTGSTLTLGPGLYSNPNTGQVSILDFATGKALTAGPAQQGAAVAQVDQLVIPAAPGKG